MATKVVLVSKRQIKTTVNFMTVTCFAIRHHNFLKTNTARQVFSHFAMTLMLPHHRIIFNFVIHFVQLHCNSKIYFQISYFDIKHAYSFLWSILYLRQKIILLRGFWTQWHQRNYSCTFFQKGQTVKLEMFFN